MSIPGKKKQKFVEKKSWVETFKSVPPIVGAATAACANYFDTHVHLKTAAILGGSTIWLIITGILSVLNAKAQDKEKKEENLYDGLLGALYTLYGNIRAEANIPAEDSKTLRLTIMRVVFDELKDHADAKDLEQLLPYIGGSGGGAGRIFSINCGIVGKAARSKEPLFAKRKSTDYEDFIVEMMNYWNYTEKDARNLREDRQAWMAVPITGKNDIVIGVVFLDSNQRNIFTPMIKRNVINGCKGIASYIEERYK